MEEIWKDVVGWEGLYQVSNLGRVKSLPWVGHHKNDIIMKMFGNGTGYLTVMLYKPAKKKLVHRLVAEAFIANPENKMEVNHIDGDKHNNVVDNLEWATKGENMVHMSYVLGKGRKKHPVVCVETGENFPSIREASRAKKISYSSIVLVLKGKYAKAGGYHWEYAD